MPWTPSSCSASFTSSSLKGLMTASIFFMGSTDKRRRVPGGRGGRSTGLAEGTRAVRLPHVGAGCENRQAPEKEAPLDQKSVMPEIALLGRFPTLGSQAGGYRRRA